MVSGPGTCRFTEVHVRDCEHLSTTPLREDNQLPAQLADLLPSPTK
jgi:hypothetical protein